MNETLSDYDNFQLEIYYAKLDLIAIEDGLKDSPLEKPIQLKVEQLSAIYGDFWEISPLVIACKNYFLKKIALTEIIDAITECLKIQGTNKNKQQLINCVYNRICIAIKG